MTIIQKISSKFNEIVNKEFTLEQLNEVNSRNKTAEYLNCCATHDFCDANMLMDEAFTFVTGHEIDLQNNDDLELWGMAWDLSKANDFKI